MTSPWIKQPAWLNEPDVRSAERAALEREDRVLIRRLGAKREEQRRERAQRRGMQRHAAGESGAVWHESGAEVIDARDPAADLVAKDEGTEVVLRDEIFGDVMAYFFTDGPNPPHVMRRAFDLAFELNARLLRDLPGATVAGMRSRMPEAHGLRVRAVIAGTRIAARAVPEHDLLVDATLRLAVAKRAGEVERVRGIELAELLQPVDGVRLRGLHGVLNFAFDDGSEPGVVVRRVFALAKWRPVTSGLIHDMTLHQLGLLFGEVRATWSWRVKQVVNRFLDYSGVVGTHAGFQRSEEACGVYAEVQSGNRNRIGGVRRTA